MASLHDERERLLREAHLLAKGQRLGELRGRRYKRFDDQGLDPFSVVVGKITVVEWMLEIPSEERVHPVRIREKAREEAQASFAQEVREGKDDPWK